MPLLLDHPCCEVTLDPARAVLRFTRTYTPYSSLADLVDLHHRVGKVLDRVGRARHTLLVDMRRAPLNNRPEFEQAASRGRAILVRDFRRVAVLVESAVGALQVSRHLREDRLPAEVFTDEAQALEYLSRLDTVTMGTSPPNADPTPPSGIASSRPRGADGPLAHRSRPDTHK